MDNQGIMAEIRGHLAAGNLPTQVIAMGYETSSVYKAQQQLQRRASNPCSTPSPGPAQVIFTNSGDPQPWLELREVNLQLRQQLRDKEEQAPELARVQEELKRALERLGGLRNRRT